MHYRAATSSPIHWRVVDEYSGDIFFYKKKVCSKKDLAPNISYIPDNPYLFDYLTGKENAQFLQNLLKMPKEKFESSFYPLAEAFNLSYALDDHVQEYSLGMRHKLYWSIMLSKNSSVLLLDEPFASFDQTAKDLAIKKMKELALTGKIIIFTSHLTDLSQDLAATSYRLENNHLTQNI